MFRMCSSLVLMPQVGLLTRGNVVRAALVMKRAAEEHLGEKKAAEEIFKATE
jgi:hypothetical protein